MPACPLRHLTGVLLGLLFLAISLHGETHTMQPVNGSAGWTATVNVSGPNVVHVGQHATYQEDAQDVSRPLAIYTARKTVRLVFDATWSGDALVPGSITINGQPGTSYTRDLTLERAQHGPYGYAIGSFLVTMRATAIVPPSTEGGEETYVPFETQFLFETRFYKPLDVKLVQSVGSFERRIVASRLTPSIYTDPASGFQQVIGQLDPLEDVGVQLIPGEGLGIDRPGWHRTDAEGAASLRLYPSSSLFNDPDNPGWARVPYTLRAVKDGMEVEYEAFDHLPHAIVKHADRVWFLGTSDGIGDDAEPVPPTTPLKPGDRLQVGTRLLPGFLDVEFYNGQHVAVNAEATEGFRVVVGESSLIKGKPLVWLDLRGAVQDVRDNPRRCLRMLVYKQLGNAVDTAIGTPDPVGWVTETPGGKVEKWLADWAEQSYGPVPSPPASGSLPGRFISRATAAGTTAPLATSARVDFAFYTDGTVWVENQGSPVAVNSEAGPRRILPAATATFIQTDATDTQQPSALATGTAAWTAPAPGDWQFQPAPDTIVTTRSPQLTVSNATPAAFLWETATLRLDGRDVTSAFTLIRSGSDYAFEQFSGTVSAATPLAAGTHTLSIELLDARGERTQAATSFTVDAPPAAPAAAQATPFAGGVWLGWERVPGSTGYRVWRAASADGPRTLLNPEGPRAEPGFLDAAPLAENVYWIESLDPAGQASGQLHAVATAWHAGLDAAPAPVPVTALHVTDEAAGLRLAFDSSLFATQRWQLARGTAPAGPFAELASSEDTVVDEFLDTAAPVGAGLYYRLTPLALDGTAGAPVIFGPFTRGTAPRTPLGFAVLPSGGDLVFTWDPATDPRLAGFRLYRDAGDGLTFLASAPADATGLTLPAPTELSRYGLAGVADDGSESDLGPIRGAVARHASATETALLAFAASEVRVSEGEGVATLTVTRTGNLAEPAVVRYATVHLGDAPGIAQPDLDYTPVAGSLLFAPYETARQFTVPLLPDALNEWPESLRLHLAAGPGANEVSAESGSADLIVEESDVLIFGDYLTEMTVNENDATVLVAIDRVLPAPRAVSATLALADDPGTAVAGVDYTAFAGFTVTFAAGQTRAHVRIPILNNTVKDGERTLHLVLRDPLGGASIGTSEPFFTLRVRDDETRPGQLRPLDPAARLVVSNADSVAIPLTRIGGTDGRLSAYVMVDGGRLPWGAIRATSSALSVSEGVTTTSLEISIDRSQLGPTDAPVAVVQVMNEAYPHESSSLLVVFPADPAASDFATWAGSFGFSGAQTAPLDDRDRDGVRNVVELAALSDPDDPSSVPDYVFNTAEGSFSLTTTIVPHARLAVVGEFYTSLEQPDPIYVSGWWEWNETLGAYRVEFGHWFQGNPARRFGRIRFMWLDQ